MAALPKPLFSEKDALVFRVAGDGGLAHRLFQEVLEKAG